LDGLNQKRVEFTSDPKQIKKFLKRLQASKSRRIAQKTQKQTHLSLNDLLDFSKPVQEQTSSIISLRQLDLQEVSTFDFS